MRMKNRFCRMSKSLLAAMCLLSMGGITYSCSDDYDLDETMPSYLGGSIYDELNARGNFKTVIKLIDDLGYKEVLSKTGSKTLFVADDEAYNRFFATTTWVDGSGNPVKNYDNLSLSQKRWLLNNSMLNNAYVLEMLSNTEGGGKNLCLRQVSAASAVDTIPFWQPTDLPYTLNEGGAEDGSAIGDLRFWDQYNKNNPNAKGIYMAIDRTSPMLTHFLEGYMRNPDINIKRSDIAFVLNDKEGWAEDAANRSYIYGSQIIEQDVTCLNGYFHVMDEVLVTPMNMAEVIRTNGDTKLFSLMLERYSAPYYDYDLTEQYKALHPNLQIDSVFQKRYLSERSQHGSGSMAGPDRKSLGDFPFLTFDPGWNEYASSTTVAKERDMGAMFVPNDAAMKEYFLRGGGKVLMDRYAKLPNDSINLEYNLFQIPLDILESLISNLMKDSFSETVPSKYLTIMNDAQDQMFPATNPAYATEEEYKKCFDKCLLANNGVVYVMNRVMSPADYSAVSAPALFSNNAKVVNAILKADDKFIEGSSFDSAPLKKYYSTYLKAMQSRFTFFIPTDTALATYGYVDPVPFARGKDDKSKNGYKYWRISYKNASNAVIPVRAEAYRYNIETGQTEDDKVQNLGGTTANKYEPTQSISQGSGKAVSSLLVDMMDQHIIVHENDDVEGINSERQYYRSRGGAPVVVLDKGQTTNESYNYGMKVNGGFQVQLKGDEFPANDHDCVVIEGYNMTAEKNGYGNGMSYMIDRPMQPTTNSVYALMNTNPDQYSEFFKLCQFYLTAQQLELMGQRDSAWTSDSDSEWKAEQNKYRIFTTDGVNPANGEQLIRFFNNFRYTIYIPTNEAMQEAYAKGLPTPQQIYDFIDANTTYDPEDLEQENGKMAAPAQFKALAMATMLVNFVKYHFQDETVYVDNVNDTNEYQTSCINNETNTYISMEVKQSKGQLQVKDQNNNTVNVVAPYNVFARDANYNNAIASATAFKVTSFAVLHQIDKVLNFKKLDNGRYDSEWATAKKAEAFVKKYELRK